MKKCVLFLLVNIENVIAAVKIFLQIIKLLFIVQKVVREKPKRCGEKNAIRNTRAIKKGLKGKKVILHELKNMAVNMCME